MKWLGIVIIVMLLLGIFVIRDIRKTKGQGQKGEKKVTPSLQQFLPLEHFHEDGSLVVNGRFRRLVHVGDLNLFAMAREEVQSVRDRFKDMLMRLDNPFQISVQARRANYTDFVTYAEETISKTVSAYQNPVFAQYAKGLQAYLKEEAQKPRTDRENLIVIGVLPKMGGEEERAQLERLDQEQLYVESGLANMGVPFKTLEPIEVVEAVQNFWNRERAVSQRYRDAVNRRTHTPRVDGIEEVEVSQVAKA